MINTSAAGAQDPLSAAVETAELFLWDGLNVWTFTEKGAAKYRYESYQSLETMAKSYTRLTDKSKVASNL